MLATGLCSQPAAWHKWVRALRLTTDNVMATATDGGGPRRWRWSLRQWAALLAMEPQAGILTLRNPCTVAACNALSFELQASISSFIT